MESEYRIEEHRKFKLWEFESIYTNDADMVLWKFYTYRCRCEIVGGRLHLLFKSTLDHELPAGFGCGPRPEQQRPESQSHQFRQQRKPEIRTKTKETF